MVGPNHPKTVRCPVTPPRWKRTPINFLLSMTQDRHPRLDLATVNACFPNWSGHLRINAALKGRSQRSGKPRSNFKMTRSET
jgi:hypothetical protein